MQDLGRWLFFAGLGLAVVGCIVWLLGRSGFRGLPGDVSYQSEHLKIYFPVVTCIALSVLLTGVGWIWRWFQNR